MTEEARIESRGYREEDGKARVDKRINREEVAQTKGVGTVVSDTLEEGRYASSRDEEALGEVQLEVQVEEGQGGTSAKIEVQVGNRRAQEAILQEKRALGAKMQARKLITE